MDSKLVEEIEEVLEKYPTPDECLLMETGDCFDLVCLLQRCLESLRWIPVSEEMPEASKKVLLRYHNSYGKQRTVCGMYLPRYFMESSMDGDSDLVSEYCEEKDEYYYVEGWWEILENWDEYGYLRISDQITHWLPIPQ